LIDDWSTGNQLLLLLLGLEEKLISFVGLGSEEARVGQEISEVDNVLINQHAGDAPSKMGSKGSLNNGIDSVANESLSICRVGDSS
jgi:hypothetical protein